MAINSVQLKKGSTTKTVQVGSKAYNDYLKQGYTVVPGTEKNAPKTTTTKTTSSSSGGTSTKTTTPTTTPTNGIVDGKYYLNGKEVSVVDYAKAQDFYNPNTAAPTAARLDEIASQDFVTPENKAAYETSKLAPVSQDYMAATYNATIPKTTIPTDASLIQSPYQSYVAPTSTTPAFGDINFATAGTTGLQAQMQMQMEEYYRKQREQQEAYAQQEKTRLQSFMDSLISPQDAKDQAWEDTGIDVAQHFADQEKGFKEIESLTNQYNKLIEAKDSQIAATQDRMASMNFINNQTAQIERNAAPQLTRLSADINAKAAVLQALQGNFAEAQKYVNQAVEDATSMNKYNYDIYKANYDMNRDNFERLGDIYTSAYEAKMNLLGAEYERAYQEKTQIAELLLKYPQSGIDIYGDNLMDAYRKAGVAANIAASTSTGGYDLTADMRNYLFAVDQGYAGTYADWMGKQGKSADDINGYAMALFESGGSLDVLKTIPEKERAQALNMYYEMQALANQQAEQTATNQPPQSSWLGNALTKPNPLGVTTPATVGVSTVPYAGTSPSGAPIFGVPQTDIDNFYGALFAD